MVKLNRLARRMRRSSGLWRDERGGTAVQAIVFLPVIIFSMIVVMYLWEAVSVRRSLHTGTYLATRYLSLYPIESTDTYQWSAVAKRFVWAELQNNPFVDQTRLSDVFTPVEVTLNNGNDCGAEFTVTAKHTLIAPVADTQARFLPAMDLFAIEDTRTGKVVCQK
jgi:Flp pilus assembly protein TadG